MAATSIIYGDDTITRVRTGDFSAVTIYDESGVVAMGVRKSLSFTGFVNAASESAFGAAIDGLHDRLNRPRQRLRVQFGTDVVVDVQPSRGGDAGADIESGPRISQLSVQQIHGGRAAFVSGVAEWTEPPSKATEDEPTIVSHRYEVRSELDETGRETRIVSGRLVLSGALLAPNPDLFRAHVYPVEVVGYQRVRQEYIVSSDGLSLTYLVADREAYRPLPDGILTAEGQQSIDLIEPSARQNEVGKVEINLAFTLTGSRLITPGALVDAAMDVLNARLLAQATTSDGTLIVRRISFTEDIFGPRRLAVTAQAERAAPRADGGVIRLSKMGMFNSIATGTHGAAGRFHQISPYGSTLVYAVHQAIFGAASDGTPDSASSATFRADTDRLSQSTDFADTDGDGIKDNVISWAPEDLDDPVPILAVEASDPDEAQVLTGALSSATDVLAEGQSGANPYVRSRQRVQRSIRNHTVVIPTADPNSADIVQQIRSPTVIEIYEGELERLGAPPVIPTPGELAGTTGDYIVREADFPASPRTRQIDARLVFAASYRLVIERVYNPAAASGTWTQRSATIAGTSRTLTEYSLPLTGLALPQSRVLDAGTETVTIEGAGRLV